MSILSFDKIVAAIMVLVALSVVSWLAFHGHEAATGAMIGVVSGGLGYYLRAKLTEPKI